MAYFIEWKYIRSNATEHVTRCCLISDERREISQGWRLVFTTQQTNAVSSGITEATEGFLLEFGKNTEQLRKGGALWERCRWSELDDKSILEEDEWDFLASEAEKAYVWVSLNHRAQRGKGFALQSALSGFHSAVASGIPPWLGVGVGVRVWQALALLCHAPAVWPWEWPYFSQPQLLHLKIGITRGSIV